MQRVLAASFAKLFEGEFLFDLLLVAIRVIVHFFANFAFQGHEIFLRHKQDSLIMSKL
jgi:hypothetical protein